jgi:hypothetical protein
VEITPAYLPLPVLRCLKKVLGLDADGGSVTAHATDSIE